MAGAKILVVEDESSAAAYVVELLESLGYMDSSVVHSGEEAVRIAPKKRPDLALIDITLKGEMDGIETAKHIHDKLNIPIVYLANRANEDLLKRAGIIEPFGYVLKPVEERRLHLNIEIALYRHDTERRFREREQWLSTILRSIGDAVIAMNEGGLVTFMNPVAEILTGWRLEEVSGKYLAEIFNVVTEKTSVPIQQHVMDALHKGTIVGRTDRNTTLVSKVGRETPIDYNAAPLRDDQNNIAGVVLVFREITKRKRAEDKLKQTANTLRNQTQIMQSIFDSIGDGVVVANESGEFMLFNPNAERIIGISETDTSPDQWSEEYGFFSPDRITPFATEELPLVRAIKGEASDEVEMFVRNPKVPDGVYVSASARPLHEESGVTKGGVVVLRDITERKRAEEALAQAYSRGRLEVVDTILHNIGNAINSVTIGIGTVHGHLVRNKLMARLNALADAVQENRDDLANYIENDPQGKQVAPFISALAEDFTKQNEKLRKTVARVTDRVEHIADIVRMQKSLGRRNVDRKDINLREAIADATKVLQESLKKRDIEVHVDCENAPSEIRIQESQFHQMLVNLIKNAIEAIDELAESAGLTTTPSIKVRSFVQPGFLTIEVVDNGIGIERRKFKVIFGAGYTTKESGSGLGLHSIANFVIGSGGKIHPLSDGIGKGATMRVILPLSTITP
ncbi:MAG: PAS domain S-box protein [Candidatus Poribacteria bacterium]|nr:PAS domain S-box protein [Candidatus Poribacteria bacterium]MDE0502978.1 PAS domain S-box protein [Candidatus Poribacteria bacterium]